MAGAGGGGLPHPGDHEAAEEPGGVVAEQAFGEPGQQHPTIQDLAHVEAAAGGADDVADEAAQQEGAQPGHDRPHHLALGGRALGLVPAPEPTQADRVVQALQVGVAEDRVGQEPGDVGEGGARGGGAG